jgi:hypothetical protein
MTIGASIFLIAVGAILAFAVADTIDGIALGTIGIILMVAGGIGLLATLIMTGTRRTAGPGVVREREYEAY